jgi:hypothetical protein
VTLEALASGLPVVATESGGISAILQDERLGALVPPQDPRMLAHAVLRTLERRQEFEPETLRSAVERFSPSAVAPRLATLYDDVIAEGGDDAPTGGGRVGAYDVAWAGHTVPVQARIVVVAHDTVRALRFLSGMPDDLLVKLTLVTDGVPTRAEVPAAIHRVVAAQGYIAEELRHRGLFGPRGQLSERLRRLIRNPVGPLQRRLVKGGLAELRWEANSAGLARALQEALRSDGGAAEVYCLDVLDYAVTQPLVAAGRLTSVPGGLLWLADRWSALQAAEMSAPPAVDAQRSVSPIA